MPINIDFQNEINLIDKTVDAYERLLNQICLLNDLIEKNKGIVYAEGLLFLKSNLKDYIEDLKNLKLPIKAFIDDSETSEQNVIQAIYKKMGFLSTLRKDYQLYFRGLHSQLRSLEKKLKTYQGGSSPESVALIAFSVHELNQHAEKANDLTIQYTLNQLGIEKKFQEVGTINKIPKSERSRLNQELKKISEMKEILAAQINEYEGLRLEDFSSKICDLGQQIVFNQNEVTRLLEQVMSLLPKKIDERNVDDLIADINQAGGGSKPNPKPQKTKGPNLKDLKSGLQLRLAKIKEALQKAEYPVKFEDMTYINKEYFEDFQRKTQNAYDLLSKKVVPFYANGQTLWLSSDNKVFNKKPMDSSRNLVRVSPKKN